MIRLGENTWRGGVIAIALGSGLHAAEIVRRDVQFSLGTAPTAFDYTINAPGGSFSGSDSFDLAIEPRLGVRYALTRPGWSFAPVVGVDALYRQANYAGGGGLSGPGAAATAGFAWAITDRWSADLELSGSYERSRLVLNSGGGLNGTGRVTAIDLRSRGLCQVRRNWLAGVELGWQTANGSFAADANRDVTLKSSGLTAALVMVWRTSMRPAELE